MREQTSFRTLLVELDGMEEGLKTDFDDLRMDGQEPSPSTEEDPEPRRE